MEKDVIKRKAIEAFGTSRLFEMRANKARKKIRFISFLGVGVPAVVGTIALSFGLHQIVVTIAGVLGIIQIIASVLSLVLRWDDDFAYSIESMIDNKRLSDNFDTMATSGSMSLVKSSDVLNTEYKNRDEMDSKQGISEGEKRMGLRMALHQHQIQCVTCNQIPNPRKPTNCITCGK